MSPAPAVLVLAALSAGEAHLDFAAGAKHWEGAGFALSRGGASSADGSGKGGTALMHRTFRLPAGASVIRFRAAAVRPAGVAPGKALDVVLQDARREVVPRAVRQGAGWVAAPRLLPPEGGKPRQYVWNVEKYAGRLVRIALIDADDRPGCHVVCSGFEVVTKDDINAYQFHQEMRKLEGRNKLARTRLYFSKHFMACSNADEAYTEYRLDNCETIHADFFEHFRKRGFEVTAPGERMMVAVFDAQAGFEAYLGRTMTSAVTGLYHLRSNRLVVYDYATNRSFAQTRRQLEGLAKRGRSDLDRERRTVTIGRYVRERRNDTNISTIMHEVAHQLSFNCGLLNRTGDVPVWLAEGLAVYCESTTGGAWQGIGEANPNRARVLAGPAKGEGEFLSLRALVSGDDWIRKAKRVEGVVLGYSQSWALFRMLFEEEPGKLKAYLKAIHARRTPDHRLADFATAFGADLAKLEQRYQGYMRAIAKREAK
jgi:hypothetical protein